MKTVITFIIGIVTGAYLAAQTNVLHMPTFHLPKTLAVDPVLIGFAVIVVLTILSATGKRGSK
ncbi:hypothetical protein [Thiothrix fructosivorans]|uniref:Uncharacterized protein n=1 Tax=Thiothrix fructosivorans TaxID=111770 RepID=A0A8B0SKM5_9GAMM|nr:hypothetical protein [Thiothrix fructosivorans]MBO0612966.1 hypothetical protein [Thiothrix fructosivorans]QTX11585.1 hypothetical protein J1836_004320 [Thiothrix fructosivorans]